MRQVPCWIALLGMLTLGPVAMHAADTPDPRAATPGLLRTTAPPTGAGPMRRLPPVERPIETVGFSGPTRTSSRRAVRAVAHQPEEVSPRKLAEPGGYPIDLPTALRLADAGNLQVAFAASK